MELLLVYDTETNGLPLWNEPSEAPGQPHITQLAAELCDEKNGNVIATMDTLIKPDGWTIPDDLAQLTGITTERALAEGIPIEDALKQFHDMWVRASLRAGHNESFDARMIRIEYFRQLDADDPFHDKWKSAPAFCTQGKSTKIINLPPTEKMIKAGRRHAKSPNLGEAYKFFTGKDLEGAHNAAVDLMACKTVYYGIKAHGSKVAA
ncbi:exonuclease domain-containing protein [Paraburkholderia silviterrae]|uniref:3'-5' exonuclease n=1 Tax=Paraburkholderia silviterrae TaxID=2528715 RepID=A0A4R5MF64_9BURK|nr:3'-5' exonuclease [Paraburkholderia silviterrae]TDG25899.1 3'-5' exonuclease [Paraburkholderia silviterrae]